MSDAGRRAVLDAKQSAEVLRYWSALLRYQEALSARPRARPGSAADPPEAPRVPNLLDPASGQDYMKLPFAGAESFLVERKGTIELELRDERVGFFEDWLAMRYRPSEEGEAQVSQLVLFPVVHLPRAELAGVLRFPAEATWLAGEKIFAPPSAAERGQRQLPEPPTQLRLMRAGKDAEQTLPFFVDTRLLRETLHVGAEELDAFFAELRERKELSARDMVVRLCDLLEGKKAAKTETPSAPELLERLRAAVAARLTESRARSRVYPVALVVNGERARATWHVQRDLGLSIEQLNAGELKSDAPLRTYLSAEAQPRRSRVCLGRWPHAPLTCSQRGALELGLGSGFCAIQGPPGSGKTTLILNGVVHQLIEKVRVLAESDVMGDEILLVTSTNNHAVDNVIDALCRDELADNPLALRLGSREVTEQVTPRALERTLSWLSRQPSSPPEGELARAKKEFAARLAAVEGLMAPLSTAYKAQAELARPRVDAGDEGEKGDVKGDVTAAAMARLLAALAALKPDATQAQGEAELAPWQRAPGKAEHDLRQLITALEDLSEQCEGKTTTKLVASRFERLRKSKLTKLEAAFDTELDLGLPPVAPTDAAAAPNGVPFAELWEEAIEKAIGRLRDLEQALAELIVAPARAAVQAHRDERLATLERELSASKAALDAEDTPAQSEAQRALYHAAIELRAAWMRGNRASLEKALQSAITQCRRTRSPKSLFDAPRGPGLWLRQLFPAFGCTLLSLGNNFSADPDSSRRVIIDEAGQCHPAYAVSALMRAPSAIVLGDVHQLEPVIGLSVDDETRIRRGLDLKVNETELGPYRTYDESGNSAQSLADRAMPERPTLRDHFRCQPEIIALCEAWCDYGMRVRTPARSRAVQAPELSAAVLFVPTLGEQQSIGGSWVNSAEIEELQGWVLNLLARGVPPGDVGIITPFRSQAEALQRALRAARVPLESAREDFVDDNLSLFAPAMQGAVALGTVHRFQGGERSIMLFSTTVTRASSLRFLDERVNLLNVAASRAKEHLIVIGHAPTLSAGRHTRVLVERSGRA